MLKISEVTIEKLRENKFKKELPEFYELKSVIENNTWHKNDTTFNHTLAVLNELEKLLRKTSNKINSYLSKRIDKNTRKEILFLATLFHDIAKKETHVKTGDISSFKNHEEIGYKKAKNILNRFDLSSNEKEIVLDIVKNHGVIHPLINPEDNTLNKKLLKFKEDYQNIFLELILLAMADTLGCQLKENEPKNYEFRIIFYQKILDNY